VIKKSGSNKLSFSCLPVTSPVVKTLGVFANTGQIHSDFIKASGKAALSPLVIINNPLASKDKKSRKYSALMQPVEAAIAFTMSTVTNLGAGRVIDNIAKKGKLGDFYNISNKPLSLKQITSQRLEMFKNVTFFGLALAVIPITSSIINYLVPKILNKPTENQDEEVSFGGRKSAFKRPTSGKFNYIV
jgi:hypothetical protein